MPNIITHILFTDDVYEKLDDPKYDFLESRLQLMEVGGNGPDFDSKVEPNGQQQG